MEIKLIRNWFKPYAALHNISKAPKYQKSEYK